MPQHEGDLPEKDNSIFFPSEQKRRVNISNDAFKFNHKDLEEERNFVRDASRRLKQIDNTKLHRPTTF